MKSINTQQRYFHVIAPWGADPTHEMKKAVILKASKSAGNVDPRFPDYVPSKPYFLLDDLVKELKEAVFVLADLSLERPSCYYEIGVAEAVGATVYIIARVGTEIHQTSHRQSVIRYDSLEDLEQIVIQLIVDQQVELAGL